MATPTGTGKYVLKPIKREKHRPRMLVEVTEEQMKEFTKVPWGLRSKMWGLIATQLIGYFKAEGIENVVSRIITQSLSLQEIIDRTPTPVIVSMQEKVKELEAKAREKEKCPDSKT